MDDSTSRAGGAFAQPIMDDTKKEEVGGNRRET